MSRLKKVIQQLYWLITFLGYNWGQSYSATLVTPPNCKKMLRNLTFAVQFAYFSIRSKKEFVTFWATFVTKKQLLSTFFEKLQKTFWKISSNFWKVLHPTLYNGQFCLSFQNVHISSLKLIRTPVNTDIGHLFVSRNTNSHIIFVLVRGVNFGFWSHFRTLMS